MPILVRNVFGLSPNCSLVSCRSTLENALPRSTPNPPFFEVQQKCMHHSSQLQRFYTNRYYKKECPRCSRPNIVPVRRCGYCDLLLTDLDIRLVGRDVFRELVASRTPNHTQRNDLTSLVRDQELGDYGASVIVSRQLATTGEGGAKAASGSRNVPAEIHRCFDFLVATHPYPISALHLSAIPKGTMYDIKQLRRAHIPLLKRMQQCVTPLAVELIDGMCQGRGSCTNRMWTADRKVTDSAAAQSQAGEAVAPLKAGGDDMSQSVNSISPDKDSRIQKGRKSTNSQAKELMEQSVIFGFTYPCGFLQLNMHAIVPPIRTFNIFEAPYFYPLKKVLQDLQNFGAVQPYEQHRGSGRFGCDAILKEVREVDAAVRRALQYGAPRN
ncbi:hypothetical protein TGPRC2_289640 [Toxoplasma gondii TgCatPRC2]|uniref:Uncharacterized protein n=2 Tax=Toxoplasma gondii TaxID=5811 RepID=A0A151HJM6_TOXGO|nr:hypothetical protein TGME49_289640 [Toxoplasma gondii ME49]EPT27959.1 hypothetical protein TGME49_289640 [Toxoplasma gondii ME49]KYK69562.1 hypothetical protein TGPRC2_289640 [Toxoplasma gondii TgCatPRC2]|eukprot:XP_002368389.1 hypothetical protein TGME49_289640 [Toxoplasma gondii ME49]